MQWKDPTYGHLKERYVILIIVLSVLGTIIFCSSVGLVISKKVDRSRCHSFADNTNRTTRFVTYNLVQWDCLTPAQNGKWIPISQLRKFD